MLRDAAEYMCTRDTPQVPDPLGSSWWLRFAHGLSVGGLECGYVPPSSETTYEGELFEIHKQLVKEIVEGHPAVIVGRGVAQTLRGQPGVLSIFLHAAEPSRIARVQQIYASVDRRTAEQMVRESDRDRARFIRSIAGCDWKDVSAYDLAIDTAVIGLDATVELIVSVALARVTA